MLEDFLNTVVKDPSLRNSVNTIELHSLENVDPCEQNAFYDTMVALVQQTPFIESIKTDHPIGRLLQDILRNTLDAGHWDYLKNLKVKHLDNTLNFDYEIISLYSRIHGRIQVKNSSDKELVVGK